MVVFDAGILIKLLDPRTTGDEREKLDYLVATLQKGRIKILIPTPALSEFYVKADPSIVDELKGKSAFAIVPFDEKSAFECAISVSAAIQSKAGKKGKQKDSPWQKVKFDHQIVAICRSNNCQILYSEDANLRQFATDLGISARSIADLPKNPASAQRTLDLSVHEASDRDTPLTKPEGDAYF